MPQLVRHAKGFTWVKKLALQSVHTLSSPFLAPFEALCMPQWFTIWTPLRLGARLSQQTGTVIEIYEND